jgi:FtsH-binding integral membrane protein
MNYKKSNIIAIIAIIINCFITAACIVTINSSDSTLSSVWALFANLGWGLLLVAVVNLHK